MDARAQMDGTHNSSASLADEEYQEDQEADHEGVPSGARHLVWAHLTDNKVRSMPGIYVQLGKRERAQAFHPIERDAYKLISVTPINHSYRRRKGRL